MSNLPNLSEVLAYQNLQVIERFKANHPLEAHRAEYLFTEMLRYLWLCEKHDCDLAQNPNDPGLQFIPVMHEEMRSIDTMWHEFILITRDYSQFCSQYFGHFIHHEPNMRETLNLSTEQFIESLQLFLNYIYDVLGEEVLKNWFQEHLSLAA
ncbi:hypothetical protein [Legionella waltersii]|uniref:Uncharacterized protein n=1 Tax=Legionella waltersii TaxID=66969 RepID=A0A0W1ANW8_9GAMM|nr:hypothetical protein [Legionella waltersii]KTD82915.1 hypothetical protein Lwal_0393 [Legionella waltersii]SNV02234.1 Uncharacterized conserved protein [Legionella waltersii]